jgi:hypothetical protein
LFSVLFAAVRLTAIVLAILEILPLDLNRKVARPLLALERERRPRQRRRRFLPVRTRPLGFEQVPPLTVLKAFDLQPLGGDLLLQFQPCGGQFGAGIGFAGADRRGILEQLSQKVGALYPIGGFVSRNRSGCDGQKQKSNRGKSHFFVTAGGLRSLQAVRGTVHSRACDADKLRFPGQRIRAHFSISSVRQRIRTIYLYFI